MCMFISILNVNILNVNYMWDVIYINCEHKVIRFIENLMGLQLHSSQKVFVITVQLHRNVIF